MSKKAKGGAQRKTISGRLEHLLKEDLNAEQEQEQEQESDDSDLKFDFSDLNAEQEQEQEQESDDSDLNATLTTEEVPGLKSLLLKGLRRAEAAEGAPPRRPLPFSGQQLKVQSKMLKKTENSNNQKEVIYQYMRATQDHFEEGLDELKFSRGDVIKVLKKVGPKMLGMLDEVIGKFPPECGSPMSHIQVKKYLKFNTITFFKVSSIGLQFGIWRGRTGASDRTGIKITNLFYSSNGGGWVEGEVNGKKGNYPYDSVKITYDKTDEEPYLPYMEELASFEKLYWKMYNTSLPNRSSIPILQFKTLLTNRSNYKDYFGQISFKHSEVVTDLVVYTWLNSTDYLYRHVFAVNMEGCKLITDQSLLWIAQQCPSLRAININGCHKITEIGLESLVNHCPLLNQVCAYGTNISFIPEELAIKLSTKNNQATNLFIDGCPIQTMLPSSNSLHDIFEESGKFSKKVNMTNIQQYQLVVHSTLEGTGNEVEKYFQNFFLNKSINGCSHPVYSQNLAWKPDQSSPVRFNTLYVKHLGGFNIPITDRTFSLLICDQSGDEMSLKRIVQELSHILMQGKKTHFLIIAGGELSREEANSFSNKFSSRLKSFLQDYLVKLVNHLKELEIQELDDERDLSEQERWSKINIFATNIKSLIDNDIKIISVNTSNDEGKEDLINYLNETTNKAAKIFPNLSLFSEDFLSVMAKVETVLIDFKAKKILPLDYIMRQIKLNYKKENEMFNFSKYMRALELLATLGTIIYLPNIPAKPVILDTEWFYSVLTQITNSDNMSRPKLIHGIGNKYWTEESLKNILDPNIKEDLTNLLLDLGILLKYAYHGNETIYVCFPSLSESPLIPLEKFWPFGAKNITKINLSYAFDYGMVKGLFSSFIAQCSLFGRLVMCWKGGAIIQQPGVDLLIRLKTEEEKALTLSSFIEISAYSINQITEERFLKYDQIEEFMKTNQIEECVKISVEKISIILRALLIQLNQLHTKASLFDELEKNYTPLNTKHSLDYNPDRLSLFHLGWEKHFDLYSQDVKESGNEKNFGNRCTVCFEMNKFNSTSFQLLGSNFKTAEINQEDNQLCKGCGMCQNCADKFFKLYCSLFPPVVFRGYHISNGIERPTNIIENLYSSQSQSSACFENYLATPMSPNLFNSFQVTVLNSKKLALGIKLLGEDLTRKVTPKKSLKKPVNVNKIPPSGYSEFPDDQLSSNISNYVQQLVSDSDSDIDSDESSDDDISGSGDDSENIEQNSSLPSSYVFDNIDTSTGDVLSVSIERVKISDIDKEQVSKVVLHKNGQKIQEELINTSNLQSRYAYILVGRQTKVQLDVGWLPPRYLMSKLEKGMRLEALDRKNPNLIAVATINAKKKSGEILIHFDGWGETYDYWCYPDDPDLHNIGYCKHVGHKLDAPKGFPKNQVFEWRSYLKECNAVAMPHHFFSQKQTQGCPATYPDCEVNLNQLCSNFLSPQVLAKKHLDLTSSFQQMYFNKDSELRRHMDPWFPVALLPAELNTVNLQQPGLWMIQPGLCQQSLHLLCSGKGLEGLHFTNKTGITLPLENYSLVFETQESLLTQIIWYSALLRTQIFLPQYNDIFPLLKDMDQYEVQEGIQRLLRVYSHAFLLLWKDVKNDNCLMGLSNKVNSKMFYHNLFHEKIKNNLAEDQEEKIDKKSMTSHEKNHHHVIKELKELCNSHYSYGLDASTSHEPRCPAHQAYQRKFVGFDNYHFVAYGQIVYQISVENCGLESLSQDFFGNFPNLSDLNFAHNKLELLPDGIGQCKNLEKLILNDNHLLQLPQDFEQCVNTLKILNISNNPINNLPNGFEKFLSLQELYASNTLLDTLPDAIGELTQLETLHFEDNVIIGFPESMEKLQSLKYLYIGGVPWLETSNSDLVTFATFQSFTASSQALKSMGQQNLKALFNDCDVNHNGVLEHEEILRLNSKICELFPRLSQDNSLQFTCSLSLVKLGLKFLSFRNLPNELKKWKQLKSLELHHNLLLESLPADLGLSLDKIKLNDCPSIKTPPPEIVSRGMAAVLSYLRRIATGSIECKRTKLMLVGLGGAGKTSLVRALMNTFDYEHTELTDGIDIKNWSVKTDEGDTVSYSVWDFAGQTVYYNTHQFFLSNRAVYLLVWNTRLGQEHSGLDFWLSSISVHAPKAPILVVGTHADQIAKAEIAESDFHKRYPKKITGFFHVSSHTGKGMRKLQETLLKTTLEQKYMGEKIPKVWFNFEEHLIGERTKSPYISFEQVKSIASKCDILETSEINEAVQFLNDLGSLQYFENEYLKDIVVINPQWIVDVMACVVSVKNSPVVNGHLFHKDIKIVWANCKKELHPWLLQLTEEFDLTFHLPGENFNIVPCLLPEEEPEIEWPNLADNPNWRESKMIYTFDYLPAGLFNRAQVRLCLFSESASVWKKGSLLKRNDHYALISQTSNTNLTVLVMGSRPENILFLVHEVFDALISDSFRGLNWEYHLPCLDCLKEGSKDPCMFASSKIRRAEALKVPFLQCDNHFHTVSLHELQGMMPPDSHSNFDIHLENSIRDLSNARLSMAADICMLLCADDLPAHNSSQTDVFSYHTLLDDLKKEGYSCWLKEKNTSVNNTEQIVVVMKDCKVILVFISDQFSQDSNLLEYAINVLHKPVIPIVVAGDMKWKTNPIGMMITQELYIDFRNGFETYEQKMKELKGQLEKKINAKVKGKNHKKIHPKCFVSYCWSNSLEAIRISGLNKNEKAIGNGDPRQFTQFLADNGVPCWMDVDQVGKNGLFEDIVDGLKHADVIVACLSDEYARSKNCQMEFRFAAIILKLPIIVASVGSGYNWESTEVGMISLGNPKISFQDKVTQEEQAKKFNQLLELVKNHLSPESESEEKEEDTTTLDKSSEFQELYELAQRKLLRQISVYADRIELTDLYNYPRLFVVDILDLGHDQSSLEEELQEEVPYNLCVKVLCEYEQGWHYLEKHIIPLEIEDVETFAVLIAPYQLRVLSILKHGSIQLECLSKENYLQKIQEITDKLVEVDKNKVGDFSDHYKLLRNAVINADKDRTKGGLTRYRMSTGKVAWLCDEHKDYWQTNNEVRSGKNVTENRNAVAPNPKVEQHSPSVGINGDEKMASAEFNGEKYQDNVVAPANDSTNAEVKSSETNKNPSNVNNKYDENDASHQESNDCSEATAEGTYAAVPESTDKNRSIEANKGNLELANQEYKYQHGPKHRSMGNKSRAKNQKSKACVMM